MGNSRFTPKQLMFLEYYFRGYSIKDAAKMAGYKGSSPQALCNSGKRILRKFGKTPKALFRLAGARERQIAQQLVDMAYNSKSDFQRIKALKILARCYY